MARLADDRTHARASQREGSLRFSAALASRLGPERVAPYLPTLLRPLYRITEPGESARAASGRAALLGSLFRALRLRLLGLSWGLFGSSFIYGWSRAQLWHACIVLSLLCVDEQRPSCRAPGRTQLLPPCAPPRSSNPPPSRPLPCPLQVRLLPPPGSRPLQRKSWRTCAQWQGETCCWPLTAWPETPCARRARSASRPPPCRCARHCR
jgi:hypothetical protein